MDWFLYDIDLRHERVKDTFKNVIESISTCNCFYIPRGPEEMRKGSGNPAC